MNVAQLMQRIDTREHFGNVEAGMSVVQDTSVVEQGSEVTSGDVFLAVVSSLRNACSCCNSPWRGRCSYRLGRRRVGGQATRS